MVSISHEHGLQLRVKKRINVYSSYQIVPSQTVEGRPNLELGKF